MEANVTLTVSFILYSLFIVGFGLYSTKLKKEYYIAPLIIFTFFENAFKHGVSKSIKNKWIKSRLSITNNMLYLYIINCRNAGKSPNKSSNIHSGIGLRNVIKRLDLIYGEKNYMLETNQKPDSYAVSLIINLHKNS